MLSCRTFAVGLARGNLLKRTTGWNCLGVQNSLQPKCSLFIDPYRKTTLLSKKSKKEHIHLRERRKWQILWGVSAGIRKVLGRDMRYRSTTCFMQTSGVIFLPPRYTELAQAYQDHDNQDELYLASVLESFSHQDLRRVFVYTVHNYISNDIYLEIEKEIIRRMPQMDLPQMLFFADGLFQKARHLIPTDSMNKDSLERAQHIISTDKDRLQRTCSNYYTAMFTTLSLNWHGLTLTVPHVVQLMFYASLVRSCRAELLHDIEVFLEENIQDATVNDIAILCHCFFSINHSIKSHDILQSMAGKVMSNFSDLLSLAHLANVMKAFRHAGYANVEFYEQLGNNICESNWIKNAELSNSLPAPTAAWITSVTHILLTYSAMRYIHVALFQQVLSKLEEELTAEMVKKLREKDLIRLLYAIQNSGFPLPKTIPEALKEELLADSGYEHRFPERFIEGLFVLACCDIVEKKLMQRVFSSEFLNLMANSMLELDFQIFLFKDLCAYHFPGEHLCPTYLLEHQVGNLKQELMTRKGLPTAIHALQEYLGGVSFLKPHFINQSCRILDLEFHLDKEMKPMELENVPELTYDAVFREQTSPDEGLLHQLLQETDGGCLLNRTSIDNIYIPPETVTDDITRVVVKLFSYNQYIVCGDKPIPLCISQMELELLSKKGYHVFAINPTDAYKFGQWDELTMRNYIQSHIMDKLIESQ